jgi:hypothetical protein
LYSAAVVVPKPHIIAFGNWTLAKWWVAPAESKVLTPSRYRDHIAYCVASADGKKLFVAQLGRKKPILKKTLGELAAMTCPTPSVERPAGSVRQPR